jgi:hypothetical protein
MVQAPGFAASDMRTRRSQSSTCLQGIHLPHTRPGCVAPRSTGHATCSEAPRRAHRQNTGTCPETDVAAGRFIGSSTSRTPDATKPWPPFAHHLTQDSSSQPSRTRCMLSHDGQSVPASYSRDCTNDHCPWSWTAHGWVGKSCSQELWTDLAVPTGPLSAANRPGVASLRKCDIDLRLVQRLRLNFCLVAAVDPSHSVFYSFDTGCGSTFVSL